MTAPNPKAREEEIERVVTSIKEYYRPEDFHCGGCLECEGCHHYFLELENMLRTQLHTLTEKVERERDEQWEVAVRYNLSFDEDAFQRIKNALAALTPNMEQLSQEIIDIIRTLREAARKKGNKRYIKDYEDGKEYWEAIGRKNATNTAIAEVEILKASSPIFDNSLAQIRGVPFTKVYIITPAALDAVITALKKKGE